MIDKLCQTLIKNNLAEGRPIDEIKAIPIIASRVSEQDFNRFVGINTTKQIKSPDKETRF